MLDCPEYDILAADLENARLAIQENGKTAVAALFKVFFAVHSQIQAVAWTQSREDCCGLFLSIKTGVEFSKISNLPGNPENGFIDDYHLEDGILKEALRQLEDVVNYDIFEAAFGDDVVVIATREGCHINEYLP